MRPPTAPLLVSLGLGLGLAACGRSHSNAPTPTPEPPTPAPIAQPVAEPQGPNAHEVCLHVWVTAAKQAGQGVDLSAIESNCNAVLEGVHQRYETLMTCILAADSVDELLACEKPMHMHPWTSVLSGSEPRLTSELVCRHVMELMKTELGDEAPMSDDDIQKFENNCIKEMDKEKVKLGAAEFQVQGACVLQAKDFNALAKCDKNQ